MKPVIAPAERSNSPPIISRATATAMMPMVEAERSQVLAPLAVAKTSVVTAKKTKTTIAATRAPTSGRLSSRPTTETDANRSSGVLPWL